MSVHFNPIYGNNLNQIGSLNSTPAFKSSNNATSPSSDKTAGIEKAMSTQGFTSKPLVVTSDEITFNKNGTIVAQRLTSTYQGKKLHTTSTGKVQLPVSDKLSPEEQKKQYIEKSLENSKDIKDCVFLMKNEDGSMTQYSMHPDKNMPNKILVLARNDGKSEFEEIDDFTFDSSSTDTDRIMRVAVQAYIETNGFDNLYQFAVGKIG